MVLSINSLIKGGIFSLLLHSLLVLINIKRLGLATCSVLYVVYHPQHKTFLLSTKNRSEIRA